MSGNNSIISPSLPIPMQAQLFSKKIQKKSLTGSVIAMLTGDVKTNNGSRKLPGSAIYSENVGFDKSSYKVNVPWIGKIRGNMILGSNTIEGSEAGRDARYVSAWYQREAFALPLASDYDVDGRLERTFYNLMTEQEDGMAQFFAEQDDLNFHVALLEGYSPNVTTASAWTKSGITDTPTKRLHPNIFVYADSTFGSFVAWNATPATYEASVQTAMNATSISTDTFGGKAVQRIVRLCQKHLKPFSAEVSAQLNGAKYVALITPQQLFQLQTEDGLFFKRFDNGAVAANVNFNITGIIGVYQSVLFITDSRAPIWSLSGSAGNYISYVNQNTDNNTARSVSELTRISHSGSAVGTMELATLLGDGSLMELKTGDLVIKNKSFDYNTIDGMAGIRMIGHTRMDALSASGSAQPLNESSIIFATPSNSSI